VCETRLDFPGDVQAVEQGLCAFLIISRHVTRRWGRLTLAAETQIH
jgi:hypothetical protein